ncbi:Glutathione S-transferase class-mu 28 kDa isozyme [Smittium culicis]|uniref:Glutathione S-transferase class-mu 28 kDa isozyme n=1 Tax=Smittium culicis TaxID=133412 RepID=A0A1R1YQQ6_9FUNG|nr:Glutathione S-transferase class-mu 28 kDa isozyme [Smittium culicis]
MSKYELFYLPFHGRSLTSKILLELGGVDWKLTHPEWPKEKLNMPYGRLPVLVETDIDGTKFTLAESRAIEEYLADKLGFYPKDKRQQAICLQYVNQIFDVMESYVNLIVYRKRTARDAGEEAEGLTKKPEECEDRDQFFIAKNLEIINESLTSTIAYFLEKHDHILSSSKSGYYFGDSVTYADIALFSVFTCLEFRGLDTQFSSTKFPHVMKLIEILRVNKSIARVVNS